MDIDDACVCRLYDSGGLLVRILIDKTGKCRLIAWTNLDKAGKDTKDEGARPA
jgi:hypothetical protein